MDPHEQLFTIQQLSQKLKIPKPTLRFWEKELDGIIVPFRTNGRQRRYTLEHISIIKEIKKFRKKGMSLAEVKRRLTKGNEPEGVHANSNKVALLANRIAEVVREEIYSLFQEEDLK